MEEKERYEQAGYGEIRDNQVENSYNLTVSDSANRLNQQDKHIKELELLLNQENQQLKQSLKQQVREEVVEEIKKTTCSTKNKSSRWHSLLFTKCCSLARYSCNFRPSERRKRMFKENPILKEKQGFCFKCKKITNIKIEKITRPTTVLDLDITSDKYLGICEDCGRCCSNENIQRYNDYLAYEEYKKQKNINAENNIDKIKAEGCCTTCDNEQIKELKENKETPKKQYKISQISNFNYLITIYYNNKNIILDSKNKYDIKCLLDDLGFEEIKEEE